MKDRFHIVYPKDEILEANEIERRYVDAVNAGEIGPNQAGLLAYTVEQMAIELEDAGFIRLASEDAGE